MYEFLKYWVEDVMTPDPIRVDPATPIHEAERILEKHDFNGLPVVEESGELVGIVTKLDLLKAFRFTDESILPPYDEIVQKLVESIMTRDVRTVCPRTLLTRVLDPFSSLGRSAQRRAADDLARYAGLVGLFTLPQQRKLLAPELLAEGDDRYARHLALAEKVREFSFLRA